MGNNNNNNNNNENNNNINNNKNNNYNNEVPTTSTPTAQPMPTAAPTASVPATPGPTIAADDLVLATHENFQKCAKEMRCDDKADACHNDDECARDIDQQLTTLEKNPTLENARALVS